MGSSDSGIKFYLCSFDIAQAAGISQGPNQFFGSFARCLFFNPNGAGTYFIGANGAGAGGHFVTDCVFHGVISGNSHPTDGKVMYILSSGNKGNHVIANNIFYLMDTGISSTVELLNQERMTFGNLWDTVTTKHNNNTIAFAFDDVDGSALFTDAGARDYTLGVGSDALSAGLDPSSIPAIAAL